MFKVSGPFVSACHLRNYFICCGVQLDKCHSVGSNLDASASSSTFPCCQWRSTRLLRGSRVSQFNYVIWYPTVLVAWCAKADPSWMVLKLCYHRRPLSIDGVLRIFNRQTAQLFCFTTKCFLILVFFADHDDYGFCMYYCMNIIDVYIHHIQYRFEAILNNEIKQVGNHRWHCWHCTAPGLQQRRANCQPCHVGRAVSPVGTAWHSRSLFAWSVQLGNSSSLAIQLNIFDLGLDELIRFSQFACVTVANTEVSSRRSILLKAQCFKL